MEDLDPYQTEALVQFITEVVEEMKSNAPRAGMKRRWSLKYKRSIDCSRPRGFSQKNYCKRQRRGGAYESD